MSSDLHPLPKGGDIKCESSVIDTVIGVSTSPEFVPVVRSNQLSYETHTVGSGTSLLCARNVIISCTFQQCPADRPLLDERGVHLLFNGCCFGQFLGANGQCGGLETVGVQALFSSFGSAWQTGQRFFNGAANPAAASSGGD